MFDAKMGGFEMQKQVIRIIHVGGFGVSRKGIENETQKGFRNQALGVQGSDF